MKGALVRPRSRL